MDNNVFEFTYIFDTHKLLDQATDQNGYEYFTDPATNEVLTFWKIKRIDSGYGKEISDYFSKILGCDVRPRFYIQESKNDLGWHTDRGTQCSINFVLSESSEPVSFRDGDYWYKLALLNVQNEHAVLNPKTDRVLFKLSIFDKTYYDVKDILKKELCQ